MPPITLDTFTWPFREPDWQTKFLIGSLVVFATSLIPVVGLLAFPVVYGYGLVIMRRVIRGEPPRLPPWQDWGALWLDGLYASLAAIGYMLPGFIVLLCAFASWFALFFSGILVSAASQGGVDSSWVPAMNLAIALGYVLFIASIFLGWGLAFIASVPIPVAVGQYLRTGEIGEGYRLQDVIAILRANLSGYALAWIIYLGVLMGLSFVLTFAYFTIVLCLFIPILTAPISFYATLIWSHLFGLAYREGTAKLGFQTTGQAT